METYLDLRIGAPKRLAYLRGYCAARPHESPKTWREVRYEKLTGLRGLAQGTDARGEPIWYVRGESGLRGERDADAGRRMRHTGWYTDAYNDGIAIGVVAYLGCSRWLAGYRWSANDERVYYQDIHYDEDDAMRMADEHARVFAEYEREYAERADAARELQDRIDEARERVRELCALRNDARFPAARGELRETIEQVRDLLDERGADHADFI